MAKVSDRTKDSTIELIKHSLVAIQNALMFQLVLWNNRQNLGKI